MELQTIGSKVLKLKSKRVANVDDTLRNFCHSMAKIMREKNGIGLSAPQVGVNKRIIIIDRSGENWVLINPEIIWFSDKIVDFEEGCLSVPDVFENVKRPESIKVKYRNLKGKPVIEIVDGLMARVVQHEIDHLDGILFIDYLEGKE
jgi:peptide deformylase